MKKVFALLLVLATVFAFAACGEKADEKSDGGKTEKPAAPAKAAYLTPLETNIAMRLKGAFDTLETALPQVTWDWYAKEYRYSKQDVIDNMKMQHERRPAELKGEYGDDMTVTYTVTSDTAMESDDLTKIAQKLKKLYKLDETKITEGRYLMYDIVLSGSKKETKSSGISFAVVKFDGVWYHVVLEGNPGDSNFNAYLDF